MSDEAERHEHIEKMAQLNRDFAAFVPHNIALGIRILELKEGTATMRLPYDEKLIGNPETGVLHGGPITALIDACCGAAVFMKLETPVSIATLDLRIDYLMPGIPGRDVLARSECFKVTRNVAFVRGVAYHDDPADPIASAAGSFMLSTRFGRNRPARRSDES